MKKFMIIFCPLMLIISTTTAAQKGNYYYDMKVEECMSITNEIGYIQCYKELKESMRLVIFQNMRLRRCLAIAYVADTIMEYRSADAIRLECFEQLKESITFRECWWGIAVKMRNVRLEDRMKSQCSEQPREELY